jgi:hypothetical protein
LGDRDVETGTDHKMSIPRNPDADSRVIRMVIPFKNEWLIHGKADSAAKKNKKIKRKTADVPQYRKTISINRSLFNQALGWNREISANFQIFCIQSALYGSKIAVRKSRIGYVMQRDL